MNGSTLPAAGASAPDSWWARCKQRGRRAWDYKSVEWSAYASSWVRPARDDQARIVIFAQGRTGSTLLESLLASTGHFTAGGELLNTDPGEALFPNRYIRGLAGRSEGNFIFHVKIYQLTRDRRRPVDPARFLRTLQAEGYQVVYLRRDNKIRHVLSNLVAAARGGYHKQDDRPEEIRLAIETEDFARAVGERIEFEEQERRALDGLDHLEVVYERDLEPVEAQQATIDRILDRVGLAHRPASTSHRKVNAAPIEDLIANYDELAQCARENNWAHFLPAAKQAAIYRS